MAGQDWDAVLDVSWQPELVRAAVTALGERAPRWLYVSSCSVYADDRTPDTDESAPTHQPWSGTGEAAIEDYGPAKVACERAVLDGVGPRRAFVCRPGLIAGYGDPSDRFGYWPARIARMDSPRERVLVPPLAPSTQVVDVGDLADWLVTVLEDGTTGTFNAVGDPLPLGRVVELCAEVAGNQPVLTPADDGWLGKHGVAPWMGEESLPLWLPMPDYAGFMTRRNDAAVAAGLRLRPVRDTVTDALAWEHEHGLDRPRRAGLSRDREAALLAELTGDAC